MDNSTGSQPPRRRRPWRRALKGVLIALAVIVAPLLLFQASYVLGTTRMVSVADRLQPAPGWIEDGEHVSGGFFCVPVAVPCDSMWRQYRTQQPVTPADVRRISVAAGLDGNVEGDCESSPLPPNVTGMYMACSAARVLDGYDVEVRVLKLAENDPERIIQFRLSNIKNRK
ncbi:hypothetical protein QF031_001113 [Pseudarthrobacter defluvii]|uniref:hypothetical protein n=1 Tax=Pseudarthrobacter defluvii TaxID=410837 RepID=UPI002789BFEB|nr:hypothetical protein [Pseudarthrobacter defluvii]MDQ0768364.1 hypothetical protein [Pseudarthrobacter defluvii]